jgi:hypothetical protein
MVQAMVKLAGSAAILLGLFLLVGCQDDKTVEPQVATFEGNYEGSCRFVQIEGEADTTVDQSRGIDVKFRDSTVFMHFTENSDPLAVFCDLYGLFHNYDGKATIMSTVVIDSGYTHRVCNSTFIMGGTYVYRVRAEVLSMVAEETSTGDAGQPVRSIKKLSLRRPK